MAYIIFIINFIVNWLLISGILQFSLEMFDIASIEQILGFSAVILIVSALFFSTVGKEFMRYDIPHRKMNVAEEKYLMPILNEVFNKAKLSLPKVFVADDPHPNAMVVGDALIIHTGLIATSTQYELAGVIAHEAGHIKNKDLTMATLNYATSQLSDWILCLGLGIANALSGGGSIGIIYVLLFFPIMFMRAIRWVVLSLVALGNKAVRRNSEYKADEFAASLGYREGITSYLVKLQYKYPSLDKKSIFRTHPTIISRLKSLEA